MTIAQKKGKEMIRLEYPFLGHFICLILMAGMAILPAACENEGTYTDEEDVAKLS